MVEWIIPILTITITPISSYISWRLGKRKRDNDYLSELQGSIDLLSEKYTASLDELILLRKENCDLKVTQQKMLKEIQELKAENEELKTLVNALNIQLKRLKKYENNI